MGFSEGGPNVPVIPTLSYWDNDIVVIRGEEHLKVVLLREDGRSKRTTATCCFSTLMVDHPYYSGVMFMLFEDACRVQQDEPDVPPTKTRPAESRIYLKDFDTSRGTLPEFRGDPTRVHQTCCPEYIKGWNRKSSPTLDNPSGEKIQALFERIPEMILDLIRQKNQQPQRLFSIYLRDTRTKGHSIHKEYSSDRNALAGCSGIWPRAHCAHPIKEVVYK